MLAASTEASSCARWATLDVAGVPLPLLLFSVILNPLPSGSRRTSTHPAPEVYVGTLCTACSQLSTPEQRASELLFPADDGGLRGEHSLREPFARIRSLVGLDMRFNTMSCNPGSSTVAVMGQVNLPTPITVCCP